MRVTSCPDCGEVVELPQSEAEKDVEVTCPTCGLYATAEEWCQFEPEDNETLLGRSLGNATIPPTMPRTWALRIAQLEEIRDVVLELQNQIRLLRQALDELNEDLPERIQRWFDAWHVEYVPAAPPPATAPPPPARAVQAALSPPPVKTKLRGEQAKRTAATSSPSQAGLW